MPGTMPSSPRAGPLARVADEAADVTPRVVGRPMRSKRYGARFSTGFLDFYQNSELSDCTVVGPDGHEYQLHGLLLAYHSEFFRRALSGGFQEGQARRIVLRFEDAGATWPTLVEYFYTEEVTLTDTNVLALFAASRELSISAIQEFCADFAQNSLEASNAIQFLSQAVQYNCDSFRASCVTLVAQSFHTCCMKPTDGLPVEVMLEILDHPQLFVQTEEQVLLFVQNYVRRHALEEAVVRCLFRAVRLPFLSNERLAALAVEEPGQGPPLDMLMAAMAQRLQLLDHPERMQQPGSGAAGGGGGGGMGSSGAAGAAYTSTNGDSRSSGLGSGGGLLGGGLYGSGGDDGSAAANGYHSNNNNNNSSNNNNSNNNNNVNSSSGSGGAAASTGGSGGGGGGGGGGARLLAALGSLGGGGPLAPRKTYSCSVEYSLPGGSEFVSIPMELVWEDLVSNLTVQVSGDTVEGDADSILRTLDDTGSWFTVSADDPSRPVWVEVAFPPHMRVVELTKYTFSHGMNMIAHMFPYGISDSSWFQMKGMSTQVSPGEEEPFIPLRTQDSCQQNTEFVVTVDTANTKQVVWRRLRILAGEDTTQQQVRLSIRKLKLYGRVEVSLLREPTGRDVVAAWRRRKEAANNQRASHYGLLGGPSFKRLEHY